MARFASMVRAGCIALPVAFASSVAAAADIVETAEEAGSFQTLLTAAEAAGLVDTLKSEGPFTVFAPTDEAFAKLPEGTVESLLKPENQDQLKAILTYHVVPGKTMSSDLAGKQVEVESVEGSAIPIDATGDNVIVGDATVTQADVEADNGVIHVIDEVIQPQS
jgi:uncharacterized surface protein with fasciclin (FAS1) repeats